VIVERNEFAYGSPREFGVEITNNESAIFHLDGASSVSFQNLLLSDVSGSGIVGTNVQNIAVSECRFKRFGTEAIGVSGSRIRVANCDIQDVGATAVRIESGDISTLVSGDSSIENCTIRSWANWSRVYEPAVRARGVGTLISGCLIEDGPHLAIDLSGNDHKLTACVIGRVVQDFDDMGAVYINQGETPLRRGISIVGNYFHNIGGIGSERHAVYIDRATCGISVASNVFIDIGHDPGDCRAIYANGASDLSISENLFIDCVHPITISFYLLDWGRIDLTAMKRAWESTVVSLANPLLPHHSRYPELAHFPHEDRLRPRSVKATRNLFATTARLAHDRETIVVKYCPSDVVLCQENKLLSDPSVSWSSYSTAYSSIAPLDATSAKDWLHRKQASWPQVARSVHSFE